MTVPLSKRSDAQLLVVRWVPTLVVLGIAHSPPPPWRTAGLGGIGLIGTTVATVIYMRGRQRPPAVPPSVPPSVPRSAGEQPEGPA